MHQHVPTEIVGGIDSNEQQAAIEALQLSFGQQSFGQ